MMDISDLTYLNEDSKVRWEGEIWIVKTQDIHGHVTIRNPDTGETERVNYQNLEVVEYA